MSTYKYIKKGNNKILVDAAYRDGNGKMIDTTYGKLDMTNVVPTRSSVSATINGKAGTKYIGKHLCIESWVSSDGTQWYRKYDDGFMECAVQGAGIVSNSSTVTSLPITFSNTNYMISVTIRGDWSNAPVYAYASSTSSVYVAVSSASGQNVNGTYIYCCGY